jgi:ABC-2 type transport system permease protein
VSALRGFVRKEVFHLLRDRQTLGILLLMPLIQVLLFGFAIRTEVDDIRLAVVDPAPDHATLALRARFDATGLFRTIAVLPGTTALDRLFERGDARQALVIDAGFAEHIARGEPARLLLITDATDPNTGSTMQAYALNVIQRYEQEARGPGAGGVRIEPRMRMRYNPTLESVNLRS